MSRLFDEIFNELNNAQHTKEELIAMIRDALADNSNNYDRLEAIRRILDEEEGIPDGELKVVQIDGECDNTVLCPVENPAQSILQFMSNSGLSVEELKAMSKDDANKLSTIDKMRWVELHNATSNCHYGYCLTHDKIEEVHITV